jgi:hypothetical protein
MIFQLASQRFAISLIDENSVVIYRKKWLSAFISEECQKAITVFRCSAIISLLQNQESAVALSYLNGNLICEE